ncbi:hypothetical protein K6L09_21165 [Burkholderia cepacia]
MEKDNFDLMFESIMSERTEKVALRFSSTRDWFRKRYDKLQELVDMYKRNPSLTVEFGDTAYGLIAKLADADGVRRLDGGLLNDRDIGDNMSIVRSERGQSNVRVASPPTSTRAAAKLAMTGTGAQRPGKASPSSSAEVVMEVPKVVVPEPIQEEGGITATEVRYDKEIRSGVNSPFTSQDYYFFQRALYRFYEEQKKNFPGKKFWTVAKNLKYSTFKHKDYIDHMKQKIVNSGLWDHFKDM